MNKSAVILFCCLIITCTLVGFVQAKKVGSPDPGSDIKLKKDAIETNDTIKLPLDKPFTTKIKANKNGILKKEKTLQTFPDAEVLVSEDTETVMQTKSIAGPALELYYGYQVSALEPWRYYYKVESLAENPCRVIQADFVLKTVSIHYVDVSQIQAIIDAGVLPDYGALP
jgi:hypothetical protein